MSDQIPKEKSVEQQHLNAWEIESKEAATLGKTDRCLFGQFSIRHVVSELRRHQHWAL